MEQTTEKIEPVPQLTLWEIKALCERLDEMVHEASLNDGPWDHDLVCDVSDQTPRLVEWAMQAHMFLLQIKDETFKDGKISGRSQRWGQELINVWEK